MSRKIEHIPRILASLAAILGAGTGCGMLGGITLGTGTQDDPVPSGTIVAQGPFTGVNGRTVSGNVTVYQQAASASTCSYVVRLQSLSAPSDASLQVIPVVNGAPSISPTFYTLRAPTGNENYLFTNAPCGSAFAQVEISNPSLSPASAQNYGIANLTSVP